MENYAQIETRLNQILVSVGKGLLGSPAVLDGYKIAIFSCKSSFMGRYLKYLLIAKKQIFEALQRNHSLFNAQHFRTLQPVIKNFALPHASFLKEGILQTYFGLIDLVKKQEREKNQCPNQAYLHFLQTCIATMKNLLLCYFINREYQKRVGFISPQLRRMNSKVSGSEKQVIKNIDKTDTAQDLDTEDETLFTEIEEELSELTAKQLISKYLKEEEEKAVDLIEICRVCEEEVQLKYFQKHMKNCSKKTHLQGQLKQLQIQKNRLYDEIIQAQKQLMIKKKTHLQEKDLHFMRLVTIIKKLQEKTNKCLQRRNSSNPAKCKIIDELKHELRLYEQAYEKYSLVHQIIQNKQHITQIKKRLHMVSINLEKESKKDSDFCSLNSLESLIHNAFTTSKKLSTKKSIFASKVMDRKPANRKKTGIKKNSCGGDFSSRSSISIEAEQQQKIISIESIESVIKRKMGNKSCFLSIESHLEENQGINKSKSEITEKDEETRKNGASSMQNIYLEEEESIHEEKVQLSDFDILKFLGKGAFGRVYLVRRKATNDLYALKHIKLENAQTPAQQELIQKQHEVFKKIAGDHLIRAPFAFTESFGHFFLLQFMPGGDLSKILSQEVYLSEDQARFYLAEIVLAVQHLHNCQIIHRDLKPQNIVIDKNGHIKLTDFGLSQIKIQDKLTMAKQKLKLQTKKQQNSLKNRRVALVSRTDIAKIIGTPDYIAPEIINQTSINNFSIDWWSLGVIAYEMLVGCRPFCAMTIEEVLKNIVECNIQWPAIGREEEMMSPEAYDLISKFLNPNFQHRIGSNTTTQIKSHPFFWKTDWQNIKNQQPPIIPITQLSKLKDYYTLQEDSTLRQQITKININLNININNGNSQNVQLNLTNFVRYDVLMEETYQSVDQRIRREIRKMDRIRRMEEFMQGREEGEREGEREGDHQNQQDKGKGSSNQKEKGKGSSNQKENQKDNQKQIQSQNSNQNQTSPQHSSSQKDRKELGSTDKININKKQNSQNCKKNKQRKKVSFCE